MTKRIDGRELNDLRKVNIITGFTKYAEGSVLIEMGDTRVICTASLEDKVPPFLRGSGKGWITAEYSMLPRATKVRNVRESTKGKASGRTQEIQRIIGRSLRSVVDFQLMGERTIWLDCDVIQADGGTRTAAITGGFVAMVLAFHGLMKKETLSRLPVIDYLAAVSVGLLGGEIALDLCFSEDSGAEVDMNVVMTGSGKLVEVQGTAEGASYTREELNGMLDLARVGSLKLMEVQRAALGSIADLVTCK